MYNQLRIALVGNSLPRHCGIATFTTDLELAVSARDSVAETAIFAMTDRGNVYDYPPVVRQSISQDDPSAYFEAADLINREAFDAVCLQHEFGIFGGEAGDMVLQFVARLKVPLVTTFHTLLDQPTLAQRRVMDGLLAASARVVVMAAKGRDILAGTYGADPTRIMVIPHGIPDMAFEPSRPARERLGFGSRRVILTFGLISPNKGIETMIEAMPEIIAKVPEATYLVLGATHPHLVRDSGEAYRESLIARVHELGLEGNVQFLDRFVERPELLEHISMCDIYVTPYLGVAQMTSGTLAYSHGAGRPIVSTPYWHAAELLADGSGVLVPFGDSARLSQAVADLLEDEDYRIGMAQKAYLASRPSTWANVAERYVGAFRAVMRKPARFVPSREVVLFRQRAASPLPQPATSHLMVMCDDTGIYQHAVHAIPDRHHGYCIDDNARALLLCCTQDAGLDEPTSEMLASRFSAFIQHGWNSDNGRFRNFMGFNRQWLEDLGSEDSHGRTLWALGACAQDSGNPSRADWASGLFARALGTAGKFASPRAWAFTLLGLDHFCARHPWHEEARKMRLELAHRLERCLLANETRGWSWFEDRLTYDNARLCEALIRTGGAIGSSDMTQHGLRSLTWLQKVQKAPAGHFRPIGSEGFMYDLSAAIPFDQQPVEAAATIAACTAAFDVTCADTWAIEARCAFDWFTGANDLGLPVVDTATGACRDGLQAGGMNQNRGAESVLSYLLGLAAMRRLENEIRPLSLRTETLIAPKDFHARHAVHQSPGASSLA